MPVLRWRERGIQERRTALADAMASLPASDGGSAYRAQRRSWLESVPATAVLPERTLLVRNEAVAHSWRRDLVQAGAADLLLGTQFITWLGAAVEVVERSGATFTLGEEAVRPARIAALLMEDLPFEAFQIDVLRTRPGWDHAIARTIADLEAAALTPEMLRAAADPRCRDLADLWSRLDVLAGPSWTTTRAVREATRLLQEDVALWPYRGPSLVEVTGHESSVEAHWLCAIPHITRVGHRWRPERTEHVTRTHALFAPVHLTDEPVRGTSEREILSQYIFASPETLADPARPRSTAIDDTVHLEQHAGIEDELDAAVCWAIGEVAELGSPLEQLAIVVPRLDPYAELLVHRFDALSPDSTHIVGGLPAGSSASGARIGTALRALSGFLRLEDMVEVIPILRLAAQVQLSRRDALSLLYELGTTGGSAAHPEGAFDWLVRRAHRLASVALEQAKQRDGLDDREAARQGRLAEQLTALEPAFTALDRIARVLVSNGDIASLWAELRALFVDHLRLATDGQRIVATLDTALTPLIATNLLTGTTALDAILRTVDAIRIPVGRFGEARVTIVALADASGLSFDCVRVLGLVEGMVPATPHEDPVLPDAVRASLPGHVRTSARRTLAQLHALHQVISAAGTRVVLSSARMDADQGYREASGVLTEAAAALGRSGHFIPDARAMRRFYFEPGRAHLTATRETWPVDERGRLHRGARAHAIAASWRANVLLPLTAQPISSEPNVMDGWFPAGPFAELPGLSAEYPISASALSRLLECPHRFLFERVLGWNPPPDLVEEGTIDALSYGSLFHEVAEHFYRAHGREFCAKNRALAEWKQLARELAEQRFSEFVERYPLVGEEVRTAQLRRLQRDLQALLDSDWSIAKKFIDVERPFGPMPLRVADEVVYVRGYIDRIDTVGATTLVRDLKTGRAKPREKAPVLPAYDIQLGLYGLVLRDRAAVWKLPKTIAGAYVYPADTSGDDRDFRDDFADLAASSAQWIATATKLMRTLRFPRTPFEEECRFCSFKSVCGPGANTRAAELLLASDDIREFAEMKLGSEDDD